MDLNYMDKICTVCKQPQFMSDSGVTCTNGHGGVDGIDPVLVLSGVMKEVDGKGALPPTPKQLSPKDEIIRLIQTSGAQLMAVQKLASAQNAMAMDLPVFKEMTAISKRLNEMMLEVSRLRGL